MCFYKPMNIQLILFFLRAHTHTHTHTHSLQDIFGYRALTDKPDRVCWQSDDAEQWDERERAEQSEWRRWSEISAPEWNFRSMMLVQGDRSASWSRSRWVFEPEPEQRRRSKEDQLNKSSEKMNKAGFKQASRLRPRKCNGRMTGQDL